MREYCRECQFIIMNKGKVPKLKSDLQTIIRNSCFQSQSNLSISPNKWHFDGPKT